MNEEEEWKEIEKNIEAMRAAPVLLHALINILIDKKVTTKKELLEYLRCNKGFET